MGGKKEEGEAGAGGAKRGGEERERCEEGTGRVFEFEAENEC
jgi:hypothetical protein